MRKLCEDVNAQELSDLITQQYVSEKLCNLCIYIYVVILKKISKKIDVPVTEKISKYIIFN